MRLVDGLTRRITKWRRAPELWLCNLGRDSFFHFFHRILEASCDKGRKGGSKRVDDASSFSIHVLVSERRGYSGPGLSDNDPIVLVVGVEDAEKRLAGTGQSEKLPEPRYGRSQNVILTCVCPVYYRLYDENGGGE